MTTDFHARSETRMEHNARQAMRKEVAGMVPGNSVCEFVSINDENFVIYDRMRAHGGPEFVAAKMTGGLNVVPVSVMAFPSLKEAFDVLFVRTLAGRF